MFNKNNLPSGFQYDKDGKLVFSLTEEEEKEITILREGMRGYQVKEEYYDKLNNSLSAKALSTYAYSQIESLTYEKDNKEKKKSIEKAIAAILKALCFVPLPIFWYDLATFIDMKSGDSKGFYEKFIEEQNNFNPDEMDNILLGDREIEPALKDAKQKITGKMLGLK